MVNALISPLCPGALQPCAVPAFKQRQLEVDNPGRFRLVDFYRMEIFPWVARYLQALDITWGQNSNFESADFLLPMTVGEDFLFPLTPMSYTQALKWFRHFCTLPWKQPGPHSQLDTSAYTLHSLKTTILSWSNQLAQKGLVTEEQRHLQGHHRRGSMRLYSRDDTAGQLALQNTLIVQVQGGFRFVTPLHRGSQRPLFEPQIDLERFSKPLLEFQWTVFAFGKASKDPVVEGLSASRSSSHLPATAAISEEQVSTDSDSGSSSSSSPANKPSGPITLDTPMDDGNYFDELVTARTTKIQHVMLLCKDSDTVGSHPWEGSYFRAACGNRLAGPNIIFGNQFDPAFPICRHSACFKHWCKISDHPSLIGFTHW